MYCVIEKTLSQDKNTKLNVKAWAKNMRKRFPCTQQLMEYIKIVHQQPPIYIFQGQIEQMSS